MKHNDLLGDNAQIHNKVYQMLRDRLLRILETTLIYGETTSGYFMDVLGITREVTLPDGREMIVEIIYQDDEHVTLTAHIRCEDKEETGDAFTYIWVGGLVNIDLIEEAIQIIETLEKQDSLKEGYLAQRDAWVQKMERGFQALGGVKTRKMKAADYVAMRKEGRED
jgi:hypothetical protein